MKHTVWIFVVVFMLLAQWGVVASEPAVQLQTEPPAHAIQPDRDLVTTTFLLPPNSHYEITIRTPASHWWVSTDFPIVENTQLYHFRGMTPSGEVRFETIYPIRGAYPIEVTANGKTHALSLQISETPAEMRNVAFFLGGLFLLGLVGGQIFLRSHRAKSALATAFLVGGLSFFMLEPPAYAHGNNKDSQHTVASDFWEQTQGDFSLEVRFDPAHAVVGENVAFDIQVKKDGNLLQTPVTVEIETFHMEDEAVMFKGKFTAPSGTMKQALHFFDGAPTRTTFTVEPVPGVLLATYGVIAVEGVSPPAAVHVKTMILLTGVMAAGMAFGFFLIPANKITGEAV